eukprot:TRINITY_DN6322_c0_g1_i1.p1 TRINITY_DN6322_c0_g1~~TRINITY_DN6322_c0_g1_i1.p1  ORF type:complete len:286 (-),score=48.15 TRINITY_DN6322_c0_g1_i1:595-1452(-)
MARPLRLASTVVLLRQANGTVGHGKPSKSLFEAFLMKRARSMTFMPNAYVFPGGALDESDQSPEWMQLLTEDRKLSSMPEVKSSQIKQDDNKLPQTISLRIAAIREVFEETGVLIAKSKDMSPVSNISQEILQHWQKEIHNNSKTFLDFCQSVNVIPDLPRLLFWSNWITPTKEQKRFDTFFFLAMLDSKTLSHASHDNVEATSSRWLSPEDALVAHESKEIMLMPPTWYTLNELKSSSNIMDLNRRSFERKKEPILPLFTNDGKHTILSDFSFDTQINIIIWLF